VVFDNAAVTVRAARIVTRITFFIVYVSPFFRAEFLSAHGESIIAGVCLGSRSPGFGAVLYHQSHES
jgi:hypothetical protein